MKSFTRIVIVTACRRWSRLCIRLPLWLNTVSAFHIPAGPETGNFISAVWYAEGPVLIGREELLVKVTVQDYGGFGQEEQHLQGKRGSLG